MTTPEEQARGHHDKKEKTVYERQRHDEDEQLKLHPKPYDDKKKPQDECPKNFVYETKQRQDQAPWKIEACRMPMSYDLGSGFEHHCVDCHYSYGRWLDKCAENFVRNGCCTCTP